MKLSAVVMMMVSLLAACGGGSSASRPTMPNAAETATPPAAAAPIASPAVAAITIDQPAAGATVSVPISVTGSADVFEAVLFVEALDPGGASLCLRRVQASSGTGTRGTWSTTLAFPPPAAGSPPNIVIRAFARSPRDGSETDAVSRDVRLADAVPDIVISEPRCNAQVAVGSTLRVAGTARVFEAALTVELRDAAGAVLGAQHVTADAGAPGTGNWTAALDLSGIVAGDYDLVAYSTSARDGTPEHVFSIPIRITV